MLPLLFRELVNTHSPSCVCCFTISAGPTQSPGTLTRWWECRCSALPFWSEKGWVCGLCFPAPHNAPTSAHEQAQMHAFSSCLSLVSIAGFITRLQLYVRGLPLPARQTIRCCIWHRWQGHSVWTACWHFQVLAHVESKGVQSSVAWCSSLLLSALLPHAEYDYNSCSYFPKGNSGLWAAHWQVPGPVSVPVQ